MLPKLFDDLSTVAFRVSLDDRANLDRNLLPCIVLHTVFNATQSVLIVEPYFKSAEPVIEPTIDRHSNKKTRVRDENSGP